MEIHPHGRNGGRAWSHWLLEGVLIFVSVGLAFGLEQYREYRADRKLAALVLESLEQEIAANRAILEPYIPLHRRWLTVLQHEPEVPADGKSGFEVWFEKRPPLPPDAKSPFPILRRSAWDAAVSGDALRLIDFGVSQRLSEIYRLQEITTENIDRLAKGALAQTATFDAGQRQPSIRMLWLDTADIESAEETLLDRYREYLPKISAAENAAH